ncbi:hypothetical protein Zm00014a_038515 [Zea mays]|uniref:Uncharacterized protein n=1 Tax=Zea mays TaxID=4577 RepID=A0A3L6FGG5_MAIZE|nr:hypothetical protein Zm00014a_038515 [Zea mays]
MGVPSPTTTSRRSRRCAWCSALRAASRNARRRCTPSPRRSRTSTRR